VVHDAVEAFRGTAEGAGIALEARVAPGLPTIEVDPVRIAEVLANLISNALRATPRGGTVEVGVGPEPAGVAFSVRDTGSGIPADQLPHIFERFVRSADSGGAGLGLAIARTLVEAHGGTITATSEPEGGVTMRFVVPTGSSAHR
jgi:two-component system sensor histidine kinase BaeS